MRDEFDEEPIGTPEGQPTHNEATRTILMGLASCVVAYWALLLLLDILF